MGLWDSYRMRLRRRRRILRSIVKSRQLKLVQNQTGRIKPNDVLLVTTIRNERIRLPYFLRYYRDLGVNNFLIIDNDSTDGTLEFLKGQRDVSVWHTRASYKKSTFGIDWVNALLRQYAHEHWCLVVDPDEFFVYPFCDTRPIQALTDWMDNSAVRSFSAMLLDLYPKGRLDETPYQPGQNPMEIACWFDSGNYTLKKNARYGNNWIQGGPRSRVFFSDMPHKAPALNKIPLVKWHRRYTYVSSTHMLLPRGLNQVYDEWGGEKASGVLLHAKFLDTFTAKAAEELTRNQHFLSSVEYAAYSEKLKSEPDLWCTWSEKYINWRQLEILGLMSKGNWA